MVNCALCALLAACALTPSAPAATTAPVTVAVSITVDGRTQTVDLPADLTVREAIAQAGISLNDLDRVTPPAYTRLTSGVAIVVVRVTESFETDQAVLPFESQLVKNEGLPEGERRLLQAGANGAEEITYRTVFEDGVQVSRSVVKRAVLTPPTPEIIMVGSQASFTVVPLSGSLVYLNGGNAWAMRNNSGQLTPLTISGDLEGRVFDLSPDGRWLLFTRVVTDTAAADFNTLWVQPSELGAAAVELPVTSALYAEWSPTQTNVIAYSTAEKTQRAPGWQANNDLWLLSWAENRRTKQMEFTPTLLLDKSAGGVYGWWGTGFAFSPDGLDMAYARTDSIGVVDLQSFTAVQLIDFPAYNTHSDWAWFPALRWGADGRFLYSVTHGAPVALEAPEDSPAFNLTVLSATGGLRADLVPRAGMFANPLPAPLNYSLGTAGLFRLAYLQAREPDNSAFSRYRLGVMDRDGSNARLIFPPEDQTGLAANSSFAWSPEGRRLAVVYDGNLWLVDADSGVSQQLTGDGLTAKVVWGK